MSFYFFFRFQQPLKLIEFHIQSTFDFIPLLQVDDEFNSLTEKSTQIFVENWIKLKDIICSIARGKAV